MNKYLLVFVPPNWEREIHIPFTADDDESADRKANKILAIWYADGDEGDDQHKLFRLTEVEIRLPEEVVR